MVSPASRRIAPHLSATVAPPRIAGPPALPSARVSRPEAAFPRASARPRAPETPGAPSPLRQLAAQIDRQRQDIDRAISQAERGRSFSPAELLALQARVFIYSENLEVISHLVDRAVSAVKTTLNTPV